MNKRNSTTRRPARAWRSLRRWAGRYSWRGFSEGLEEITKGILRMALLALVVLIGAFVWNVFRQEGYRVDPFSVPHFLAERGYTEQVVSRKIQDELVHLKQIAATVKADSLSLSEGDGLNLDLAVMGVGFDLRTITFQLRQLFGRQNRSIGGEITHDDRGQFQLTLRMTGFAPQTRTIVPDSAATQAAVLEQVFRTASELVLLNTDPYRLALVHIREARFAAAMETIRHILKNRPDEAHWGQFAWGHLLDEQNEAEAAVGRYRRCIELQPEFSPCYARLAQSLLRIDRIEEALAMGERAIALDAKSSERHINVALLYYTARQYDRADSLFEVAVRLEPNAIGPYINWVSSKMNRNDTVGILPLVERLESVAGETSVGYMARAAYAMLRGDTTKYEQLVYKAFEIDPASPYAAPAAISTAYNTGDYELAVRLGTQARFDQINKYQSQRSHNLLAMANNMLGRHDAAFRLVRKSIDLNPASAAYPYSTLGETFAFTGELDSAYHYLERSFAAGADITRFDTDIPPYTELKELPRFRELFARAAER